MMAPHPHPHPGAAPHPSGDPHLRAVAPAPELSRWRQPRTADGSYVEVARRALPALTSLRWFAALYVVVHHLINLALLHAHGADADRSATWYLAWGTQGHVGVTFFFVLSGFILAWCYHRAFAAEASPAEARRVRRRFWLARFARVWPLHAAMFALFVPITLQGAGLDVGGLLQTAWQGALNLTLLHAWVPLGSASEGLADTFNAPSWTLSCEALFYLAFPALATLLVRRLRWGINQLTILAVGSWVLLGAAAAAASGFGARGEWLLRVFPGTRIADFVVGVALGLIVVQVLQRRTLRGDAPTEQLPTSARWTAVEAAVLAATCLSPLVWALAASDVLPATFGTSWFHLPAIAAAILVLALERGALSRRLLALRPLVWLGEVSYALYLVHMFLLLGAWRVGAWDRLGAWPTSLLLLAVSVAVAAVVHERFEKPARARIVRRFSRA